MRSFQKRYRIILYLFFWITLSPPITFADVAWLDGDPNAIWNRSPGFYKEGSHWYAIIHVKSTVTRVRLAGEFTDGESHAIDLTKTPDGKFWWFKGTDADFLRAPIAGDPYKFILNEGDSENVWTQDPAARWVESSDLSKVTVSSDYPWHDSSWSRPGWKYYLIYQLHPLCFTARTS